MRSRLLVLALFGVVPVVACGSNTESDDVALADASGIADTGSSDTGSDLDATPIANDGDVQDGALSTDAGDAAACIPQTSCGFSLAQQGSAVVAVYDPGVAPVLNGGTIRDATFVLTGKTYFERETNGPSETTTQTIRWACGTSASVTAMNGTPLADTFAVITSMASNKLTETVTNCNVDAANVPFVISDAPFEATATTVKIYIPSQKALYTYTKI